MVFLIAVFLGLFVTTLAKQPNFIFIITDDQDLQFNSTDVMPNMLHYIRDDGITFNNAFVATSICCPSRTETVTGRLFHNIRETNEKENNCMHIAAEYNMINNSNNMFQIFNKNNYLTASFGKVVNDQGNFWCSKVPNTIGLSRINTPCPNNGNYYSTLYFDKYINGKYLQHNITMEAKNYLTSYVGNRSIDWIHSIQNNTEYQNMPFLMWIGFHAPHADATPAKWYVDRFNDEKAPKTPNYNIKADGKVLWIENNTELNKNVTDNIDQQYRDRLRSLLSVDDYIYELFSKLNELDILNDTYVIFTSDHGFHLGQNRVALTKHLPYDTDVRVPLFMRGPGIKKGSTTDLIVGNVDIVPTLLELADISYSNNVYDGMSWKNIFNDNDANNWRDIFLSEYISIAGPNNKTANECAAWIPGPNGATVPGKNAHAPCCDADGNPYLIDDGPIGNWRSIRIINDTDNLMYVEWIELPWNQTQFENPFWKEFYNE